VNAIIASQTVTRSWRAGFLVGVGATTADTIFLVIAFLARTAVAGIGPYVPFIALLGAGVMVYFAWGTVRSWRRAQEILESKPDEHAKSYMTGLSVNITNPYRSEEHTSELQSRGHLVCRLLLEKKKKKKRE